MQKRNILWWMFFSLLVVYVFVTMNINIAIVSMTNNVDKAKSSETGSAICPNTFFYWNDHNEDASPASRQDDTYDWSEQDKNMALSAFFWLSSISGFTGGYLSHKYGSKIILGYSLLISSILSSLIPICASQGPLAIAFLRMLQGIFAFIAVPGSLLTIMSSWTPPQERGKFFAVLLIGTSLGLAIGSFTFGLIAQYMNWKFIFYFTSLCGTIWFCMWHFLIYETPERHPTITPAEKEYITSSLKTASNEEEDVAIPWKSILTSIPFIVTVLCIASFMWHYFLLSTYMPSYLKSMYGMSSSQIGIITSFPAFISGFTGYGTGLMGDLIVSKGWMSMTRTRKLFTLIACTGASSTLIVIAFTKCNIYRVVVTFTLSVIIRDFYSAGVGVTIIDLSPRFCGILNGCNIVIVQLVNVGSQILVTYLSNVLEIEELWRTVFLFTAITNVVVTILFLLYGSSEVQPWNSVAASPREKVYTPVPIHELKKSTRKDRANFTD